MRVYQGACEPHPCRDLNRVGVTRIASVWRFAMVKDENGKRRCAACVDRRGSSAANRFLAFDAGLPEGHVDVPAWNARISASA